MNNPLIKIYQGYYNIAEQLASVILMRPKGQLIRKIKNIKYGDTRKSVCDYIFPKNATQKMPIMVYIHGGGWISGYRRVRNYYCYEYAEKGFFVVNIDYDYATDNKHPFQINQILSVIDSLYEKREELNLNFDQLVIGGDSAGAYLAAMVSGIVNCNKIENISPDIKHLGKYKIKALLSICGAFNVSELCTNKSLRQMPTFISCYTGIPKKKLKVLKDNKDFDLNTIINDKFPRTFIIKAINDKLMIESDNFERTLSGLNVQFDSFLATGIISFHCFPLMCRTTVGRECLQLSIETLKKFVQ